MTRYFVEPSSIEGEQLFGAGGHSDAEVKSVIKRLSQEGKNRKDLVNLLMEVFGLTEAEAEALVADALQLDDPQDDLDDEPSPGPSW